MNLEIIILAAGKGTRMRSGMPKVLHPLAGQPLLRHVLETARGLDPARIHVVVGHGASEVRARIDDNDLNWVIQDWQGGTGHAVMQALPAVAADSMVLVMYGDVPLIGRGSLAALIESARQGLALLTARLDEPGALGRIIRGDDGRVIAIREFGDASRTERAIDEVNTGFLAAPAARLGAWLARVGNDNAQKEYYLTDVVALAVADGAAVNPVAAPNASETLGVNSKKELAEVERVKQRSRADRLMDLGVTIADPARLDIRGTLRTGADCSFDVDVIFEGEVSLGDRVRVGPFCLIRNAAIGSDVSIEAHTVIDGAAIGDRCNIGPFARIRPETVLGEGARIGNFVETKKADIGAGSKANHLAYVGDASVGSNVNIGAGVITCNYDGVNKHRTEIGNDVFIGSDSQLIAPVKVGDGAFVAAGSTITSNAPPGGLTVSRARQKTITSWKRPVKK